MKLQALGRAARTSPASASFPRACATSIEESFALHDRIVQLDRAMSIKSDDVVSRVRIGSRQSGRLADGPSARRLRRAEASRVAERIANKQKARRNEPGFFHGSLNETKSVAQNMPSNFFLKRDRRPPRSIRRCVAAGPGRMRGRIDVEVQLVAFLAVGRVGDELGAVGHLHLDLVVVGVEIGIFLHGCARNSLPCSAKACPAGQIGIRSGLYSRDGAAAQAATRSGPRDALARPNGT